MKLIRLVLLPFSWIYGFILLVRNKLYDLGVFSEYHPEIKTICIGNLALGGTGKTPHIEYLIRYLKHHKVAVLSRGYGRSTSGTIVGDSNSTAQSLGDEPLQILLKFPEVPVVVEANRKKGIEFIIKTFQDTEIILLDDAFQHRRVRAGLNILLTTYDLPYFRDHIIPAGTLRDHPARAKDADFTIITKVPSRSSSADIASLENIHSRLPHAAFSRFQPGEIKPVLKHATFDPIEKSQRIALISGIAKPQQFENMVSEKFEVVKHFKYPDHYVYGTKDLERFHNFIGSFGDENIALLTTEKDAARLAGLMKSFEAELPLFYQEISVVFEEGEDRFHSLIDAYVKNN
jgi:tetraacyldisaccharide 4'-kinase